MIETFTATTTSEPLHPGCVSLAVDAAREHAIVGGSDGVAGVYAFSNSKTLHSLRVGGAITASVWYGSRPIVASSSGVVKIFENGSEVASFTSHAGSVNALAMHPSGEILASVGIDKSFVFYDLPARKVVFQIFTDAGWSPLYYCHMDLTNHSY